MKMRYLILLSGLITTIYANYKSQEGQDKFVNEYFFKNKRNGIFVDIGAHDGVTYSNTWFFEKILGWKGICFEPIPSVFKKLRENRECICINAAVSDREGTAQFREIDAPWVNVQMLSGLESKYDPRHVDRLLKDITTHGGSFKFIDVQCCLLNNTFDQYGIKSIDLLSIDTEGGELDILKTIDFDKYYVYCITVENNYATTDIRTFLESKNFQFITYLNRCDEIYINKNVR